MGRSPHSLLPAEAPAEPPLLPPAPLPPAPLPPAPLPPAPGSMGSSLAAPTGWSTVPQAAAFRANSMPRIHPLLEIDTFIGASPSLLVFAGGHADAARILQVVGGHRRVVGAVPVTLALVEPVVSKPARHEIVLEHACCLARHSARLRAL